MLLKFKIKEIYGDIIYTFGFISLQRLSTENEKLYNYKKKLRQKIAPKEKHRLPVPIVKK